ncbi:integrin alpha-8-like [Anneissia japonica]|uniref:integrin alpha-8-like n=1 Tax=Anneissia japonica TaxID=1529436 RepID=UPI0014256DE7|nr:integrin alpha-8-like [Anneissia japonica]
MDERPVLSSSMGRRLLCIFVRLVFITLSYGYNLDTSSPIVHIQESGGLFGFSVAQHSEGSTKWLIIGAPNANTSTTRQGAVYRCPVTLPNPGSCSKIDFDSQDTQPPTPNVRNDQWLGASVASSGATVVACAPRFVWRYSSNEVTFQDEPVGRCHTVTNNFRNFKSYSPCHRNAGSNIGHSGITHCQAGMAIDIDEVNSQLLLGAPGSYYWQGQGILLDLNNPTNTLAANKEEALTFDDSYRGYSVAFLRLAGLGLKNVVVGVPRGKDLLGLVQILSDVRISSIYQEFQSDQMGSYFGQSLAVSDFNGDGREDLVVGAPLYVVTVSSQKRWEAGQVYIYYQDSVNRFGAPDVLSSSKTKARFGFSLAALGDINLDGFNDLAVGAPYDGEAGDGLVYIYSGHNGGLRKRAPQIIEPSAVSPNSGLSTFGYSLAGGLDMDNNNYPDVLVGSAYSNAAVLLRSRPIVKLSKIVSTPQPSGINLDERNDTVNGEKVVGFDVTTCFEYKGKYVPSEIIIQYTIKLDSTQQVSQLKRALFMLDGTDSTSGRMMLNVTYESCVTHMAYIKVKDKPLYFVNNCPNNKCIPDLELKANVLQSKIIIGDTSDLVVNISITNKGQSAYQSILNVVLPEGIGYSRISNKQNTFKVACTEVQGETSQITCDVGNPMPENYKLDFELVLTTGNVMGKTNTLKIAMSVGSSNAEAAGQTYNNDVNITVPVDLQFSISLKGVSKPGQLKFSNEVDKVLNYTKEEQIGDEVEHFYEIRNTNTSYFGTTELVILFPMKNKEDEYLLYLTSITASDGGSCTVEGGNVNERKVKLLDDQKDLEREGERVSRQAEEIIEEVVFNCDDMKCVRITCIFREIKGISALPAGSNKVKISIMSRLWAETFQQYKDRVELISVANVTVRDSPYDIAKMDDYVHLQLSAEVKTTATPEEYSPPQEPIKWWIYVAAIAGGLLLFILLTVLLWKCGFFKRKKYHTVNQATLAAAKTGNPSSHLSCLTN